MIKIAISVFLLLLYIIDSSAHFKIHHNPIFNGGVNGKIGKTGVSLKVDFKSEALSELRKLIKGAVDGFTKLINEVPRDIEKEFRSGFRLLGKTVRAVSDFFTKTVVNTAQEFLDMVCCLEMKMQKAIDRAKVLAARLIESGHIFLGFPFQGFIAVLQTILNVIGEITTVLADNFD